MLSDIECRTATCPEGKRHIRLHDGGSLYLKLKLTHFHGHLTVQERGVRSAQIQAAVPGGVSSTNH